MTDLLSSMRAYRRTASWAVWGSARPTAPFTRDSDLALPVTDPDLGRVLRSDVVLLGLNPGNAAHDRAPDGTDDYMNFHTGPKHNDHLIAEAFRDTQYWGSYMTDLYAQIESRSALVKDVPTDIDALLTQIATLNGGEPVRIMAFGGRTFSALNKHSKRLAASGLVSGITKIPHYSGSNNGQHKGRPAIYRQLVNAALSEPEGPRSKPDTSGHAADTGSCRRDNTPAAPEAENDRHPVSGDSNAVSPGVVVDVAAVTDTPAASPASGHIDSFVELAGGLYAEAERCAHAELWRAAILLIGGAVEAVIVGTAVLLEPQLREQGVWPKEQDPLRWHLGVATQLARDSGWLEVSLPGPSDDLFQPLHGEVGDAVRFLVTMRNMMVHPGAYVRAEMRPDLTDLNHMQPTYDILHGIAAEVFGRLAEVLVSSPADHP